MGVLSSKNIICDFNEVDLHDDIWLNYCEYMQNIISLHLQYKNVESNTQHSMNLQYVLIREKHHVKQTINNDWIKQILRTFDENVTFDNTDHNIFVEYFSKFKNTLNDEKFAIVYDLTMNYYTNRNNIMRTTVENMNDLIHDNNIQIVGNIDWDVLDGFIVNDALLFESKFNPKDKEKHNRNKIEQ